MKDQWVATALSDDSVVVELLFRLKQSSSEPPKPPPSPSTLSLPNGWGHRQPRSKTPISGKKDSVTTTSATRCSPTTPLSWSGGAASPSDGAYDDCSNSSGPSFDPTRSKSCFANNEAIPATPSSFKKSRKKKASSLLWVQTFAELKEEENLLLKERLNLTKELASLHFTLKEQKVRRDSLNRIKLDLNIQHSSSGEPTIVAVPNRMEEASTSSDPVATATSPLEALPRNATPEGCGSSSSGSGGVDKEVVEQRGGFVLPDLNMMPLEEEEILY